MKVIISLLFFVVTMLNAGYITPPLQAVLDTLSPGNKTTVCVHLAEKPNLSRFQQKAYAQKIAYLKEFSQRIQRPLIIFVNTYGNQIDSLKSFWVFNGLSFQGTKNAILAVAPRHDVEFVSGGAILPEEKPLSGIVPPSRQIEWNIETVRANDVWLMGITGDGVVISIFDSGMREDHESYGIPPNYKWRLGPGPNPWEYAWFDAQNGSDRPWDPQGHGTHVGGIAIGGDGNGGILHDIGVAPGAKLIACRSFSSHECFQWIAGLAEFNLQPDVVNCSWGDWNDWENIEFWDDVVLLRNLGIIPIFCIGNKGLWSRSWPPGNFPHAIGVGATDINDIVASFSCPGPAPTNPILPWSNPIYWSRPDWDLMKPDIMAPGTDVNDPQQGDGIVSADKNSVGGYVKMWGTSQATPHITGAIALMLEVSRDVFHYDLNYYDIYDILLESANRNVGGSHPNIDYGWGRLDCQKAVDMVLNYHLKSSSPVATGPNNGDRIAYGGDKWHLVYESGGPMAKYVRYTVSTDHGATWSFEANGVNNERIGKIGEGGSPALSVLSNGDAHVVWVDGSSLLYSKKPASSPVWTEPLALYNVECVQKNPSLAVDPNTNIGHVAFVNSSFFGDQVIYGWFDTQDPALSYFSIDAGEVCQPSIGLGADGPHIAWQRISEASIPAIYYVCAPDWITEEISMSADMRCEHPDLAVSPFDGTVAVVWEEDRGSGFDIRCRRKVGGMWQHPEWVCQTAEESRHPVITTDTYSSHCYVAWADSMTSDYDWEVFVSTDYGLGWGFPRNISGGTRYGSKNPQIGYCPSMMIEGILVAAYSEGSSSTPSLTSSYVPVYEIKTVQAGTPYGGGPQGREHHPISPFFFRGIHPNPAKGSFQVLFNSPDERIVTVKMYDVNGRLVINLYNNKARIGLNVVTLASNDLSSGVYFIKVEAGFYRETERIIYLR